MFTFRVHGETKTGRRKRFKSYSILGTRGSDAVEPLVAEMRITLKLNAMIKNKFTYYNFFFLQCNIKK